MFLLGGICCLLDNNCWLLVEIFVFMLVPCTLDYWFCSLLYLVMSSKSQHVLTFPNYQYKSVQEGTFYVQIKFALLQVFHMFFKICGKFLCVASHYKEIFSCSLQEIWMLFSNSFSLWILTIFFISGQLLMFACRSSSLWIYVSRTVVILANIMWHLTTAFYGSTPGLWWL